MNFFIAEAPNKIFVQLGFDKLEEVKDKYTRRGGHYFLASDQINGKPHWLQEDGFGSHELSAIWFYKNPDDQRMWVIGNVTSLGESWRDSGVDFRGLFDIVNQEEEYEQDPSQDPTQVNNKDWEYWHNDAWHKTTSEIKLHPVRYSGKLVFA